MARTLLAQNLRPAGLSPRYSGGLMAHRDPREPTAKDPVPDPSKNPAAPTRRDAEVFTAPVIPQPEKNQAERERDGETNVTDAPKPETKKQSGSR